MAHEHAGLGTGLIVDTAKVAKTLIKPGTTFLDVGCGPGDYIKAAAIITKKLIAIDIDAQSIRDVVKLDFKGLEAIRADATKKIPLRNNAVDSILLANVLHGFVANKQDQRALREILRVLRPEGRIGIVEFKENSPIGPPKNVKLSQIQVEDIMRKHGVDKTRYEDVGTFHYMLVFEKRKAGVNEKNQMDKTNKLNSKKTNNLPQKRLTKAEKNTTLPKVFWNKTKKD